MSRSIRDISGRAAGAGGRLCAWARRPFESWYRWGLPTLLFAAACYALPAWLGPALFAPLAAVLGAKAAFAVRRIHRLELVAVVECAGIEKLSTERDRVQRSWALGCGFTIGASLTALTARALFSLLPGGAPSPAIATYLAFSSLLLGGFLLFYVLALRFDGALLRGLASIAVTLPAFFIVVAVASLLVSWAAGVLQGWGLSTEGMVEGGFAWLSEVQGVLGTATTYFLQQDSLIIAVSVVLAALLLLFYTATVPLYWMRSARRWLRGMGLATLLLSAGAIVFAGAWVAGMQDWAAQGRGRMLGPAGLDSHALLLSNYRREDMAALIRALVLPYTVGVFVANAVLAQRMAQAKEKSDAILNQLARSGSIDEAEFSQTRKRYLYYCGNRALWDVALRSIGCDVTLPQPFAPRRLTWKERIRGEIEEG